MATTEIEKESLEAHVELCAVRYGNLDERLQSLHDRVCKIESMVTDIKQAVAAAPNESNKTFIAIGTTLVGALIGIIGTLMIHIK